MLLALRSLFEDQGTTAQAQQGAAVPPRRVILEWKEEEAMIAAMLADDYSI